MSRQDIASQEHAILGFLKEKNGKGASVDEIRGNTGLDIEVRTLQRRLEKLRRDGKIYSSGNKRSTLYFLADEINTFSIETPVESPIPLTDQGKAVLKQVSLPIQQRKPAGFNRNFLEQYRPNRDSYLSEKEKEKLSEIGRTNSEHLSAGTYAKDILNRLLIDLSWNSSRLEGNTYSLLDTERLIAFGEIIETRSPAEAQMILNHKDAIEFLVRDPENIGFNRYTILNLHAMLSNNLLANPAANGKLRSIEVGITGSVYTPLAIPQLIEEMFELMLAKAEQIKDPFEQALFIMVQLPYLQPFDDVNKRVSRLAANISFNRHNLSPLSFVDVPKDIYIQSIKGVYELNKTDLLKDVFIWAYQRSAARYAAIRQSLGEPDPIRVKYREQIRNTVSAIVMQALQPQQASMKIKESAMQINNSDQQKFIEIVETELLDLHEGNFARFWISPDVFKKWKERWTVSR
jgi:hypothetical protein